MKHLSFFIGIFLVILIPQNLYSQIVTNDNYNKEETAVINTFLYKIIDADRLWQFHKDKGPMILYFDTKLACNQWSFDNIKKEYAKSQILRRLNKSGISDRIVDSLSIKNLKNILIRFDCKGTIVDKIEKNKSIIGEVSFSRVSFNLKRTFGYFYYSFYCGEDCGWGGIVRIIKKNGKWEISKYLSIYVL